MLGLALKKEFGLKVTARVSTGILCYVEFVEKRWVRVVKVKEERRLTQANLLDEECE